MRRRRAKINRNSKLKTQNAKRKTETLCLQNESGSATPRGLRAALEGALSRMREDLPEEITVRLVDDRAMKTLNFRYKGLKATTDVLSFDTGDIVISIDTARVQAIEQSHSLRREILHLAVHGMLHLLRVRVRDRPGFNDDTESGRREMERRTLRILKSVGA